MNRFICPPGRHQCFVVTVVAADVVVANADGVVAFVVSIVFVDFVVLLLLSMLLFVVVVVVVVVVNICACCKLVTT